MRMKLSKAEESEKRYFDKIAKEYDDNYHYSEPFTKYKINKKSGEFIRIAKKYSKVGGNILEVGCGTGEYTKHVAEAFPRSKLTALDISGHVIDIAKKKCLNDENISFVVRSAYRTGFCKESFDIVFGFYVLHHVSAKKLMREAYRVLKPGGLVFFYEPNLLNPIVYFIKSSKSLKKRVGDTPHEWAINPLTISKYFSGFKIINIATSEFVPPLSLIGTDSLITIDRLTSYLKYIPLIKYFGGSVRLVLQKK